MAQTPNRPQAPQGAPTPPAAPGEPAHEGAADAAGTTTSPDLELQLADLSDSHERFEAMLEALQQLAGHLKQLGPDERARALAADVLAFFDGSAPRHRDEEEREVLPLLRQCGGAAGAALAARLEAEHRLLAQAWAACRPALAELSGAARWPAEAAAFEFERWRDLVALAMGHMLAENGAAFPMLRALLLSPPQPPRQ